jgi:hypothetical protein
VLSPGWIAIMVLRPVVNARVEVVQSRLVIAIGFFGSAPDVDFRTAVMMRTILKYRARFSACCDQHRLCDLASRAQKRQPCVVCHVQPLRIRAFLRRPPQFPNEHRTSLSEWTAPLYRPFETLIAPYRQCSGPEARSAITLGRICQMFRQAAHLCGHHVHRSYRFYHDSCQFSRRAHKMQPETISSSRGRSPLNRVFKDRNFSTCCVFMPAASAIHGSSQFPIIGQKRR